MVSVLIEMCFVLKPFFDFSPILPLSPLKQYNSFPSLREIFLYGMDPYEIISFDISTLEIIFPVCKSIFEYLQ